jgi:hypothetical protein
VLGRLVAGEPLSDPELGSVEGRADLRGLVVPAPRVASRQEIAGWFVEGLEDYPELGRVRLQALDLSGALITGLRLLGATVSDCRFDGATLRDLRAWETTIEDSSFAGADLRDSSLGGWPDPGEPNRFERVDFSGADLRGVECQAACFSDCDFSGARLEKIEFGASNFVSCRFAGELREVLFYERIAHEPRARNEMRDVDFSQAELRWVEFRGLALDRVRLPESPDHLLVRHYPCAVRRALAELDPDAGPPVAGVRAALETELEWLNERRSIGIFHRHDYLERAGGDEELRVLEDTLRRAEQACAQSRRGWVARFRR